MDYYFTRAERNSPLGGEVCIEERIQQRGAADIEQIVARVIGLTL